MMNIENYYFLLASGLALFFSIGHALWGWRYILKEVQVSQMSRFTKHMLWVIWNQPTVFHFLAAIFLAIASTSTQSEVTDLLTIFIALVSFGFFLNYVVTSLVKNKAALSQIIPQTIALSLY